MSGHEKRAQALGSDKLKVALSGAVGDFALNVQIEAPLRGITTLFGPSGSGKTTVLRFMAGLQRFHGVLKIGDDVWQDSEREIFLKPHKRAVGYVFQEPSLFPHLSVRENLLYGARRADRDPSIPELLFDDVAELLGISALIERSPRNLSGGERQRVAIGRALLSQPRLLLMDEPLAGLDHKTKSEILPYLEALHDELSVPVIYVSHDLSEVARLADRVAVLSSGRVSAIGEVAKIFERLDLPEMVGEADAGAVLLARITRHDEEFQLTHVDHRGQTITMPKIAVGIGKEVRLRIRARDVSLATHPPAGLSVRNILAGVVTEIREQPNTAHADALVDIGEAKLRARITRAAIADLGLVVGMSVFALVKSVTLESRS